PWLLIWMEEQLDGPYWRHGSLRPAYSRIECPTMVVAGWADGYRNNTFRTFENLQCPKELLIGPWSHMAPATSLPGPHIDLVAEMIRFFGKWLRDDPFEVRPAIRVFVRHATKPAPDLALVDGAWRYEETWPPQRLMSTSLHDGRRRSLATRPDTGIAAWNSCAGGLPWGQPLDQRNDDAWSLTTDWPVASPTEVLGHVVVKATVTSDQPIAYLSVKLNDVWPDGTSALVTRGLLNLTHRVDPPAPLVPGQQYEIEVEMEATSWVFPAGHSIRLSVAGNDWPNTWVPPLPVTLTIEAVEMRLPDVPSGGAGVPEFAAVEAPVRGGGDDVTWDASHNVLDRVTTVATKYGGPYDVRHGGHMTDHYEGVATVSITDPASATARGTVRFAIDWPEASIAIESRLLIASTADEYAVDIELDAFESGDLVAERRWSQRFPRRLA
ncbi:MAG: CocE/NonD family hydrolase C-terminal non-catalytic domain-containing protein, partial [Ilumatobacteraceae bacterium]